MEYTGHTYQSHILQALQTKAGAKMKYEFSLEKKEFVSVLRHPCLSYIYTFIIDLDGHCFVNITDSFDSDFDESYYLGLSIPLIRDLIEQHWSFSNELITEHKLLDTIEKL